MINVFQPSLDWQDVAAISAPMLANWPGRGAVAAEFEKAWASRMGVASTCCIAVTSATEGLFAIMRVLPGSGSVVMPSLCFSGAANAVMEAGLRPVFCDVDRRTLNPTRKHIAAAKTPDTQAVLVLHYAGVPTGPVLAGDDDTTLLIEDCACTPASRWQGDLCGRYADFAVWSFDAMKIMTTGDGGMLYARREQDADWLRHYLALGQSWASGIESDQAYRWWKFDVTCSGRRGLMNDMTASLGLSQLRQLANFVNWRRTLHQIYDSLLAGLDWLLTPPAVPEQAVSSHYCYHIQLATPTLRDVLATYLRVCDIYTTFRYYPLHRIPFYACTGQSTSLPNTDYAADHTLLLPLHQGLRREDIEYICKVIHTFGKEHGL